METVVISKEEHEKLRALYEACVQMRDARKHTEHPLRDWNRMSPAMRLAVVELDALYRGSR